MTATAIDRAETVPSALLDDIREHASALDKGEESARRSLPALGAHGLLDLGAPRNRDGGLPAMAETIASLASVCMSTAFTVWAQRMTIEYLLAADTAWSRAAAEPLRRGTILGVTGMASAFKEHTGCGDLDLTGRVDGDDIVVDGVLRWASNLYADSLMVTAVRTDDDRRLVLAFTLDAPGVELGRPFSLLGLDSTASSSVKLEGVRIPREQILTEDLDPFLARVRPTFALLQSAMCLGLAQACLPGARKKLTGTNEVFTDDVRHVAEELTGAGERLAAYSRAVGTDDAPTPRELLELRLDGARLATRASGLEVRTAGGAGYASGTPVSRRHREAAFIPVQSPSEAQLRWELARLG